MSFEEWKEYKLGDFADVQNGYAFKANDFGKYGTPIIKIKNIADSKINLKDVQHYNAGTSQKLKQFQIKRGDILISMTGSHINQIESAVGKVGKYQFDYPAFLNQRVGKVYIKDKNIGDENYLYYFLNRFETQFELASSAGGSANQANISPTQIKNLKVVLPPLPIQRRIAAILSSLDDKIELNRQTAQTLEAIAQALFKEWFVDFNFPGATGEMQDSELGEIPVGWKVGKLGDVLRFKNGKSSPERNNAFTFPVYGANGIIGFSDKYNSKSRNIVIGRVGSFCGAVYYTIENSFVTENAIIAEEINVNSSMFCFLMLQSLNLNNYKVGSGQPLLNQSILSSIKIILPSTNTIEKFEQVSFSLFNQIFHNEQQTQTLTQLRDTLLPKLMKGEINIQPS